MRLSDNLGALTERGAVSRAAFGFRAHSGWAVLVVVAGSAACPAVIHRRRIELADPAIRGSSQPYHAAREMSLDQAEVFLERCASSTAAMAQKALQDALDELTEQDYRVDSSCILSSSGRPLPELAAILASHPLIHTAEGEFFRESLRAASKASGLAVSAIREKDILTHTAKVFAMSPNEMERRASALGKAIGSPWRRDEKFCALAGWLALKR